MTKQQSQHPTQHPRELPSSPGPAEELLEGTKGDANAVSPDTALQAKRTKQQLQAHAKARWGLRALIPALPPTGDPRSAPQLAAGRSSTVRRRALGETPPSAR